MFYVYSIENTINGKKYIGFTDFDPTLVSMSDLYVFMANQNGTPHMLNAMRNYGHYNFKIEIKSSFNDSQEASLDTDEWIEFYDTLNPENGYQQNLKLIPLRDELPEWLATNVELTERMRKAEEIAKKSVPDETTMNTGEWVELTCKPTPDLTPSKASDNPYDLIIIATKLLKEMQQAYLRDDYSTVMDIYKDFSQYVEVDKKLDDIICDLLIDAKDEIINLMDNLEF